MARSDEGPSGGVVIWKPVGITSRAALEVAERALGAGPLGHTGTLDPLAEGLLLLLGGEARKFQPLLVAHDKRYRAEVLLGANSATDDAEGPLSCPVPRAPLPEPAAIERALARFRGGYEQVPPRHSAVHVEGERAWQRARRGEAVEIAPRAVRIDRIELLASRPMAHSERGDWLLELEIDCGTGTYIRALARDLGAALGTGAHLAALARTRLGALCREDATPLAELAPAAWRSLEEILAPLSRLDVETDIARRLSLGQRVAIPGAREERPEAGMRVIWCAGVVAGLAELTGGIIRPRRWRRS